ADTAAKLEKLRQTARAELQELEAAEGHLSSIALLVRDVDLHDVVAARLRHDRQEQRRRERAVRDAVPGTRQDRASKQLVRHIRIRQLDPEQDVHGFPDETRQVQPKGRIVATAADTETRIAARHGGGPRRLEFVEWNLAIAVDQKYVLAVRGLQAGQQRTAVSAVRLMNHVH